MQLDIWSDIACPWCFVGKRRLERALDAFDRRDEVEVRWRSFELDPGAPAERGGDSASNLAAKYGMSVEQARERLAEMTQLAATEGAEIDFDLTRSGNTFDGHRLTHLALEHGLQSEMKERLMRAHFAEGLLVSDPDTLRRLALEVGLPAGPVQELLDSERLAEDVRVDEYTAQRLGIDAVPFFVFDRRIAVRGAAGSEELLRALEHAAEQP